MKACGQSLENLVPGKTVCLPGAELPGCANVKMQGGNKACKYYIMQAGDSIATVADALNMYQENLAGANPAVAAVQGLLVGQLLKLPPWNDTECGDLGLFEGRPPVKSPPPAAPAPAAIPNTNDSRDPNAQLVPTTENQTDKLNCRGFVLRQGDDLYSVSALFNVDVSLLVAVNPDLGSGKPFEPGTIIKIPPYDNTCINPTLVTAEQLAQSPAPAVEQATMPSPSPGFDTPAITTPPPVRNSNSPRENTTAPSSGGSETDNVTDGLGRDDSIAADPAIIQNIVFDGNTNPPKGDNPNTGTIIMLSTLVFAGIAIFGLLGLALSGAGMRNMTGKKVKIKPEENPYGVV